MTAPTCPGCNGALWCDPRLGLLGHHDDQCQVGADEANQSVDDRQAFGAASTQSPHHDRLDGRRYGRLWVRAITPTEVDLLVACGADRAVAARATVAILFIGGGIRRRVFGSVQVSALPNMPLVDPWLVG